MKDNYDPPDYPENPPWTMFFDGPLYEKYKEFMANKDFSKILLTSKLKLANEKTTIPDIPDAHVEIDWWAMDHGDTGKDNQVASDTYNTVSDTFYKKFTRGKQEEKRRTRRTRAIILLIILVLLAVSLGTALIIHYFLVPKDEDIATAQVNISFSGNTSILGMTTDTLNLDKTSALQTTTQTIFNTSTAKEDEDSRKEKSNRGHGVLEDTTNVTVASTKRVTKVTTKITVTTEMIDPFDFFSMDDNMTTTTTQPNQTTSTDASPKTTLIVKTTIPSTSPSTTTAIPTTATAQSTIDSTTKTTNAKDRPSSEAPPPVSKITISTMSSEYPSTDSTKAHDISESTTTESLLTNKLVTDKDIPLTTSHPEIDTKPAELTTTNQVTLLQTAEETTLTPVTATEQLETTTALSDPSFVLATSTNSNIDIYDTSTEENTTLNVGTETLSTTPVVTTSDPTETTSDHYITTTDEITTVPINKTEFVTETTGPITTGSETNVTFSQDTTSANLAQSTVEETTFEVTTVEPSTTIEPLPHMVTEDETAYKKETARIVCRVTDLGRFVSLSIKEDKYWSPIEVTLYSDGSTQWSFSRTDRYHVTHELKNISGSNSKHLTVILEIKDVECKDAGSFKCVLQTRFVNMTKTAELTVVGRPDKKVNLQLGPSIVEDRAFRITAIWQAGYPIPWTNMSWMALDAKNQTYNLEDYGEYRDYELKEDHLDCQTFLKSSLVIFPKVHLNDTTVIVKPDLYSTRSFVDDTMKDYLRQVKFGVEKIRVIPLNYCPSVSEEQSIPHPYTDCTKFIWCLPGNLFVQQCPTGTCFYEKWQECL